MENMNNKISVSNTVLTDLFWSNLAPMTWSLAECNFYSLKIQIKQVCGGNELCKIMDHFLAHQAALNPVPNSS